MTDAKPLATSGVWDMRASPANSAASEGIGRSLAAAYIAPKYDVLAIKLRRENTYGSEGLRSPARIFIMIPPFKLLSTLHDWNWREVILAETSSSTLATYLAARTPLPGAPAVCSALSPWYVPGTCSLNQFEPARSSSLLGPYPAATPRLNFFFPLRFPGPTP